MKDSRDRIALPAAACFGNKTTDHGLKNSTGGRVHQGNRVQRLQDRKIRGDQQAPHPEVEGEINDVGQSVEEKQSRGLHSKPHLQLWEPHPFQRWVSSLLN